ncbi:MAG: hypothetical protein WCV50_04390 [Patescibacteria group bacterium]|jgi:hypothetical protein
MNYLIEFFALTREHDGSSAVWRCRNERLNGQAPFFQKVLGTQVQICSRPSGLGGLPVGAFVPTRRPAGLIGITRSGLCVYSDCDQANPAPAGRLHQRPDKVRSGLLDGSTGEVVALFLDEHEAAEAAKQSGVLPLDQRWHRQTRETLEAIGLNHPIFISSDRDFQEVFSV